MGLTGQLNIAGNLLGNLEVTHDVAGVTGQPAINIAGTLMGQIRINGSLWDDDAEGCTEIYVGGMPDPLGAAAIVVNWDGYGWEADQWQPNATITVGTEVYSESDPAAHVMTTTCQKGDLDGSGATNNFDITPFVQALNDGVGYDEDYPLLAGARDFHGDCNGDGVFNNFDITPFVLRLTDEEAYFNTYEYPYAGCPNPGDSFGGGSFEPAAVAAVLKDYLDSDLMPRLIRVAEYVIENSSDGAEAEFWEAVLAELE